MDALQEAVVEWLMGERLGQRRDELVREIYRLASHCKLWPEATREQWNEAVDQAIAAGLVWDDNGVLRVASKPRDEQQQEVFTQLELF